MTQLFVQLTTPVTGSVMTIAALEIVAATIGFITAWVYARSISTPIIKGLEADKLAFNKQVVALKNELNSLNEKINTLNERIGNLKGEIAEKDKEIKDLSSLTVLTADSINVGKYVISKAKNDDNYFNLKFALQELFKRPIDLLESKAMKNPYIIRNIDNSKFLIYGV